MKKHILLLNTIVIVPCLILHVMGVGVLEPLWLMVFIISIVNACKSDTKKEFLIYSLILFVISTAGVLAEVCFDIAHHPEWKEEIQLLMTMHVRYMLVLTGIEFLRMWIGAVMKKKVRIEKVFSDGERVYVKLSSGVYDKIYRAAMGVYWDKSLACLYFRNKEISDNEAVAIICEAVKREYGIVLCVDEDTVSAM